MHQTTVRFGSDLWESLERESEELGVSVAQFVREAALARLMYNAGRRGDAGLGAAFSTAANDPNHAWLEASVRDGVRHARDAALENAAANSALRSQGKQACRRAAQLRAARNRNGDS